MNFKNIGIIDDSIGGLEVLNKIKELYNENFIYFADLKNYPYGMWDKSLEKIIENTERYIIGKNIKCLIYTNPLIALESQDKSDILKINGIDSALNSLKDEKLMVFGSRKLVENDEVFRIEDDEIVTCDATVLINTVQDGDRNEYLIKELIKEYLGDYKGNILLLDSNLSLLKEYFNEIDGIDVYTINDYIIEEFKEKFTKDLRHSLRNKMSEKYFVSDHRIAFYLSAETFLEGKYSKVKMINNRGGFGI